MKKKTLFKQWPENSNDDFKSFLEIIDIKGLISLEKEPWDEERPYYSFGGDWEKFSSEKEFWKAKDSVFRSRLSNIERQPLFKTLARDESFKRALEWIESRKEFESGSAKVKIKLIYIVSQSLAQHKKHIRRDLPLKWDMVKIKRVQIAAKSLLDKIDDAEGFLDVGLISCCRDTRVGLEYIIKHRPIKLLRDDKTYIERSLLSVFVFFFMECALPRSPTLMEMLLEITNYSSLLNDRRNLIKNIRDIEDRLLAQKENFLEWRRVRKEGVGKSKK